MRGVQAGVPSVRRIQEHVIFVLNALLQFCLPSVRCHTSVPFKWWIDWGLSSPRTEIGSDL